MMEGRFPIPSSLHDLEREPYNLLPYPVDFIDDDEAARADSFAGMVHGLEQGNRSLVGACMRIFQADDDETEQWLEESRMQALYTHVR